MSGKAGKMGGLALLVVALLSAESSAGWGQVLGRRQGPTTSTPQGGMAGQVIRNINRVPGIPGIPGMQIKGMPHIPGMPGLPGVGSLPGLISKLR